MKLSQRARRQTGVVFIYDPIPMAKISLDALKTAFPKVTSFVPEDEMLLVESPDQKVWAQVFSARLEYANQIDSKDFSDDELHALKPLLTGLPPIKVKSFGVSLHIAGRVDGFELAGAYLTKTLLKDHEVLEKKLGAKIIASAQRFTYGEPTNYYDVRFSPADLRGPTLNIHFHGHRDVEIVDAERILSEVKSSFDACRAELDRLIDLV
jgi:hypothetical protein